MPIIDRGLNQHLVRDISVEQGLAGADDKAHSPAWVKPSRFELSELFGQSQPARVDVRHSH